MQEMEGHAKISRFTSPSTIFQNFSNQNRARSFASWKSRSENQSKYSKIKCSQITVFSPKFLIHVHASGSYPSAFKNVVAIVLRACSDKMRSTILACFFSSWLIKAQTIRSRQVSVWRLTAEVYKNPPETVPKKLLLHRGTFPSSCAGETLHRSRSNVSIRSRQGLQLMLIIRTVETRNW